MTVQAAPALVAGAALQPQPNAAMTAQLPSAYTVQRPFFWKGERMEIGATVDLPWPLAVELANAGKVTPVVAVETLAADPVEPLAADSVAEPAANKRAPRRPVAGASD